MTDYDGSGISALQQDQRIANLEQALEANQNILKAAHSERERALKQRDEAQAEVERLRAEVDRLCEAVYERAENCLRAEWERNEAWVEVGQLTRERDEALAVVDEMLQYLVRLNDALDESEAERRVKAEAEAEVEQLRATVARVTALADEPSYVDAWDEEAISAHDLRAALDGGADRIAKERDEMRQALIRSDDKCEHQWECEHQWRSFKALKGTDVVRVVKCVLCGARGAGSCRSDGE